MTFLTTAISAFLWRIRGGLRFCGTCLTGFIITFIWSLLFGNIWLMISGLMMGSFYLLGWAVSEYVKDDGKFGWYWGEWIFGGYLGIILDLI